MLRKMINRLLYPNTCDNDHFISYLRRGGATVGESTRFIDPKRCSVDPGRLDYIKIGSNCCLSVVSLIAHDYSWYVFADSKSQILPDAGGKITIGDNCFIGYQTCILKDTIIGDNVIIGARSVVKGLIPSNTVWAGVPARQICTLDEMYEKRINTRLAEAKKRRDHIIAVKNRKPTIEEMGYFSFLFLERNEKNYEKYIKNIEFNGEKNTALVKNLFFTSSPCMNFDTFLKA